MPVESSTSNIIWAVSFDPLSLTPMLYADCENIYIEAGPPEEEPPVP